MPSLPVTLLDPLDPQVDTLCAGLARSPAESFFLSHWWLDACLETWPATTGHRVLAVGHGPALALLGARTQRRHGWLRSRRLGLNEALDDDLDEPTIELNGFYGARTPEFGRLFDAVLGWLDTRRDWDELRVPGVLDARAAEISALAMRHGLRVRTEKQVLTWWVSLDRIRADHRGDYLAALSPNTRQQLRRARRAIERAHDTLTLDAAGSVEEALAWLDELAVLHRARWTGPSRRSGFDIPSFRAFHRTLVRRAFDAGGVQMLRIRAGDQTLGWIYNLVLDGHVHFLMSGIDYSRFDRFKPGLLAHQLAIEHNLAAGARIYDFLGGSQRYKASLATHSDTQRWIVLWRPRPGLLLEDALRRIRQRFIRRRDAAPSTDRPAD